jgi:tetratricopeptide (TPR) repeat protein
VSPRAACIGALLLLSTSAWALGPFEANPPAVARGLKAFDEGRYEDALREFNAAEREAPRSPALEYTRGNTRYRLKRYDEAKEAYHRAAENADASLRERDLYNMGDALAEMGDTKGAIDAFRKALVLEPRDEARATISRCCSGRSRRPSRRPAMAVQTLADRTRAAGRWTGRGRGRRVDGGQGDGGQRGDGGTPRGDGGTRAGMREPGTPGGRGRRAKRWAGARMAGWMPGRSPNRPMPASETELLRDAGVGSGSRFDRNDAERLLDAMKQNERNLQLWRFQQKKKTRKPDGKDW